MRIHFAIGQANRSGFALRSRHGLARITASRTGFAQLRKLIRFCHPFALVLLAAVSALLPAANAATTEEGQFGGNLELLRRFHNSPQMCGESNHYIDLWDGEKLPGIVHSAGLRNNRALFVNSHGKAHVAKSGLRYAFYPHQKLLPSSQLAANFSARDLATVLGNDADKIHNIVLAGCDTDRAFDSAELRKYFVNATNITHTVPGTPGYQPMFLQAILSPSDNIETLYEVATTSSRTGQKEYRITNTPKVRAVKLLPYVADLYQPGATKPYRTQIAGRELLEPPSQSMALVTASTR